MRTLATVDDLMIGLFNGQRSQFAEVWGAPWARLPRHLYQQSVEDQAGSRAANQAPFVSPTGYPYLELA